MLIFEEILKRIEWGRVQKGHIVTKLCFVNKPRLKKLYINNQLNVVYTKVIRREIH